MASAGNLQENNYTWTSAANIIFLESPAFVGWSYSNTSSDLIVGEPLFYGPAPSASCCAADQHSAVLFIPIPSICLSWGTRPSSILACGAARCCLLQLRPVTAAGDVRTARDSLMFLKGFLERFPVYQGRPFWIAGESYGGMYNASPCDHPATPWQRCSCLGKLSSHSHVQEPLLCYTAIHIRTCKSKGGEITCEP